jgi:hypothetical protein
MNEDPVRNSYDDVVDMRKERTTLVKASTECRMLPNLHNVSIECVNDGNII